MCSRGIHFGRFLAKVGEEDQIMQTKEEVDQHALFQIIRIVSM